MNRCPIQSWNWDRAAVAVGFRIYLMPHDCSAAFSVGCTQVNSQRTTNVSDIVLKKHCLQCMNSNYSYAENSVE